MSEVLIGRCDEYLVAFPRPIVRQVVSGPELGAPDARLAGWCGQLAWRGGSIPLVDLRVRLGAAADTPPARAVVTAFGSTTVALALDDVLGLEATDLAQAREPLPGLAPIARTADAFLVVVDFTKLFNADERARLQAPCDLPALARPTRGSA